MSHCRTGPMLICVVFRLPRRFYTKNVTKVLEYKKCYEILGVPETSDQETVRKAYLDLVKKYHPDSGSAEADAAKFTQIDNAFRTLQKKPLEPCPETVEQDIQHTAPQHRQYLNYGGVGSGTPFQREKQYIKMRAAQASENVLQHRLAKVSAEEGAVLSKNNNRPLNHKIKTKYGFDRLVEDLIQESMSKGEFNNLSGAGKPLNRQNFNPYVDFVTHKINEVLIDNGFTPEWITLQKEIREEIAVLRDSLMQDRRHLGSPPFSEEERDKWQDVLQKHEQLTQNINRKIDKFNLVVPILNKQMIQVNLSKEGANILNSYQGDAETTTVKQGVETTASSENLFGFIDNILRRNKKS